MVHETNPPTNSAAAGEDVNTSPSEDGAPDRKRSATSAGDETNTKKSNGNMSPTRSKPHPQKPGVVVKKTSPSGKGMTVSEIKEKYPNHCIYLCNSSNFIDGFKDCPVPNHPNDKVGPKARMVEAGTVYFKMTENKPKNREAPCPATKAIPEILKIANEKAKEAGYEYEYKFFKCETAKTVNGETLEQERWIDITDWFTDPAKRKMYLDSVSRPVRNAFDKVKVEIFPGYVPNSAKKGDDKKSDSSDSGNESSETAEEQAVKKFVVEYNKEEYQRLLNRLLHSDLGNKDPEEWAEKIYRDLFEGDGCVGHKRASELNEARKKVLELLKDLVVEWDKKFAFSKEFAIAIKEVFTTQRLFRILNVGLVMDRAQSIYMLRLALSRTPGIPWSNKLHRDEGTQFARDYPIEHAAWQKKWEELIAKNEMLGEWRNTMDTKLFRLLFHPELGLQKDPVIKKWSMPQDVPPATLFSISDSDPLVPSVVAASSPRQHEIVATSEPRLDTGSDNGGPTSGGATKQGSPTKRSAEKYKQEEVPGGGSDSETHMETDSDDGEPTPVRGTGQISPKKRSVEEREQDETNDGGSDFEHDMDTDSDNVGPTPGGSTEQGSPNERSAEEHNQEEADGGGVDSTLTDIADLDDIFLAEMLTYDDPHDNILADDV